MEVNRPLDAPLVTDAGLQLTIVIRPRQPRIHTHVFDGSGPNHRIKHTGGRRRHIRPAHILNLFGFTDLRQSCFAETLDDLILTISKA